MSQAPAQDDGGGATGMRRSDRVANLVIAAIVMAVAVAAIVATRDFPATMLATDVGPARFPIIYAIALLILCAVLIVSTLRKPVETEKPESKGASRSAAVAPNFLAVAIGMGMTLTCIVAMSYVGYAVSTLFYLSGLMALMGRRHRILNPLIAVVVTAIIYVTFSTGLSVPLPVGSLFE